MKRLFPVLVLFTCMGLAGNAEGAPFLSRLRLQLGGPIQLPIPAFPPFFPGGTIVIDPRDRTDPRDRRDTDAPLLRLDPAVKTAVDNLYKEVNKESFLNKTNDIPKLPKGLRVNQRDTEFEKIKPFASPRQSSSGLPGVQTPLD